MKIINFINIEMTNFCCYTYFTYKFVNNTISLITGPNGVGKSSIFDCILFTLFGVTGKGAKSDDVVNNVIGKNCKTSVEFSVENNNTITKYLVERYVKDSKLGDTVLLFKDDGKKPIKKGHKEVTSEIEKIVCNQKLFNNTLLFGQKVKDFFTDLPDSERKDIFRKVLQLDNYVMYYDITNNRIKQTNNEIQKINSELIIKNKILDMTNSNINNTRTQMSEFESNKNKDILVLTDKISMLNDKLSLFNQKLKSFVNLNDNELKKVKEDLFIYDKELDKIKVEIDAEIKSINDARDAKILEFKSKSDNMISELELEFNKKISKATNDFNIFNLEIEKKKNEINSCIQQSNNKINNIDSELKNIIKDIEILESNLNRPDSICPTCKKPLTDATVKKELTDKLNKLIDTRNNYNNFVIPEVKNSIQSYRMNLKIIINSENDKNNEIKLFKNELQTHYTNEKQKIINRKNEAQEKVSLLSEKKKNEIQKEFFNKNNDVQEKIHNLKKIEDDLTKLLLNKSILEKDISETEMIIKLNETLLDNKKEEKFNTEILENYITEKNKLEEEMKNLNSDIIQLSELSEMLEFWKEGFSQTGIPSLLIDESIPALNGSVFEYLEKVGGRYKASFDTISTTKAGEYRDKINVNVLDTLTKANNRKQLSGGQTRIIDIAILLSLCDLQNNIQDMKTNILLLDEIFDSLDDQNIGYVSSLLRSLVSGKSINIISHRHIDSIEADNVIRLF